eukprot:tig00021796_g23548.t1
MAAPAAAADVREAWAYSQRGARGSCLQISDILAALPRGAGAGRGPSLIWAHFEPVGRGEAAGAVLPLRGGGCAGGGVDVGAGQHLARAHGLELPSAARRRDDDAALLAAAALRAPPPPPRPPRPLPPRPTPRHRPFAGSSPHPAVPWATWRRLRSGPAPPPTSSCLCLLSLSPRRLRPRPRRPPPPRRPRRAAAAPCPRPSGLPWGAPWAPKPAFAVLPAGAALAAGRPRPASAPGGAGPPAASHSARPAPPPRPAHPGAGRAAARAGLWMVVAGREGAEAGERRAAARSFVWGYFRGTG